MAANKQKQSLEQKIENLIYFVRHGAYGSKYLTNYGIEQVTRTGKQILEDLTSNGYEQGLEITIYTSPLTRAVQTAQILQQILGQAYNIEIVLDDRLEPDSYEVENVVKEILDNNKKVAIIVSHKPDLEHYLDIALNTGDAVRVRYQNKQIIK